MGRDAMTQALERRAIDLVEGGWLMRVDVEDGEHPSGAVDQRNHDLGARRRVAGHVSREGVDVGHELGLARTRRGAADAAVEGDVDAGHRPLEGADPQQLRRDDAIEAGPAGVGQGLVNRRRQVGHQRYRVAGAVEQSNDLEFEVAVTLTLVGLAHAGSLAILDAGRGVAP